MQLDASRRSIPFAVIVLLGTVSLAHAGPYHHKGIVQLNNWRHDEGFLFGSLQVKYLLTTIAGQPRTIYVFRYEPPDESIKITAIHMRARVKADGQVTGAYVNIHNPMIGKPKEWGSSIGSSSSPSWGPGEKSWKPSLNAIFYSNSGTPLSMKEATNFYKKSIELVQLEVVSIRISTDKDSRGVTPLGWLRKIFRQRKRGENYVPPEVEKHFDENRQPGKVYLEATVDTESNIGKFSRSTTAMQWQDEEFVYAKLRFRWIDWPSAKKIDKPVKVQIQVVWESNAFVSVGRKRIVTVTQTTELKPGEEITIVDRMEKSKVEEFRLQPKLIATADLPSDDDTRDTDNPLAKIDGDGKEKEEEANPLANYVRSERERIAREKAEQLARERAKKEADRLAKKREADRLAAEKARQELARKEMLAKEAEKKRLALELARERQSLAERLRRQREADARKMSKRTKGNVVYVLAVRVPRYSGQLTDEDRAYIFKHYRKLNAYSPAYKIELSDDLEWDDMHNVSAAVRILKPWAESFSTSPPADAPTSLRAKLSFKFQYECYPTKTAAEKRLTGNKYIIDHRPPKAGSLATYDD